jgi:hypothetical protein
MKDFDINSWTCKIIAQEKQTERIKGKTEEFLRLIKNEILFTVNRGNRSVIVLFRRLTVNGFLYRDFGLIDLDQVISILTDKEHAFSVEKMKTFYFFGRVFGLKISWN